MDFNILNLVIKPRIHHEPEKKTRNLLVKLSWIMRNVAKDGLQSYTFLEYDILMK